ncbi:MAG TPA: CoA-binding protein [Anaerolineales bacterium]|nr:CoA-binding protein [Anaerolineales bacterium]
MDSELRDILKDARKIAVVGLSSSPGKASYRVAAYLKHAGYRLIPVNPHSDEILGEKSYPDLEAIEEAIDVVQVFRPSGQVIPIVEQAIRIEAKVVWMQLGIVNEAAAEIARAADVKVVMDRCMKVEHRRLIAGLGY